MDIEKVRLKNMRWLMRQYGNRIVMDKLGMERSQLSQIAGRNPTRNIGRKIARRVETSFGFDPGWMDTEQDRPRAQPLTAESGGDIATVDVQRMDVKASAGGGIAQPEYDVVLGFMKVSLEWIRRNVVCTAPTNLKTISAAGMSMSPTFNDGDILFIDVGVRQIEADDIYVVAIDGELYVKRFERRPREHEIWMHSDNKMAYPEPHKFTRKDAAAIEVLGKVVWIWNGQRPH